MKYTIPTKDKKCTVCNCQINYNDLCVIIDKKFVCYECAHPDKICDVCGKLYNGQGHYVYNENSVKQVGLLHCGCDININSEL